MKSNSTKWPLVALEDVCVFLDNMRKPVTAKDRKAGSYPYYGANGVQDYVDAYLFDEELVLLAEDGGQFDDPSKGVAYRVSGKCWVNNHAHVLRPKNNIDVAYLGHVLRQYDVRPFITGAVVKKLNNKAARRMLIPLPPLSDQKRIVSLLDQADTLRSKRRESMKLMDEYMDAVFTKMFGNPTTNPKNWRMDTLRNICTRFSDGPFGSKLKSEHYRDKGVRVIRLQNIGINEFKDKDKAFISVDYFESDLKKFSCKSGDIVIATLGDPNIRACVIPKHLGLAINKADCIHCVPKTEIVTIEYLVGLLNLPEFLSFFSHLLHGQTRTRVSSGQLKKVKVPIPPLELQQKYCEIIKAVERNKASMLIQSKELENQFDALMQRTFSNAA